MLQIMYCVQNPITLDFLLTNFADSLSDGFRHINNAIYNKHGDFTVLSNKSTIYFL